jgi:hypothetical protein
MGGGQSSQTASHDSDFDELGHRAMCKARGEGRVLGHWSLFVGPIVDCARGNDLFVILGMHRERSRPSAELHIASPLQGRLPVTRRRKA